MLHSHEVVVSAHGWRGFCVRVLCRLRVGALPSTRRRSAVCTRSLCHPRVVASASVRGCPSLSSVVSACAHLLRPSRAVALTSVSSYLSVSGRLLWCLPAVCFGVRMRLLRRPHLVASVKKPMSQIPCNLVLLMSFTNAPCVMDIHF